MKIRGVMFYTFIFLAFIGSALGDRKGGDLGSPNAAGGASPGTAARVCPLNDADETSIYVHLYRFGETCLERAANTELSYILSTAGGTKTIGEYRAFFKDFCQKQEMVRACFADVRSNLEVCGNESRLKTMQVFREMFEKFYESGCEQEGERHAYLFHEYIEVVSNNSDTYNSFFICLARNLGMIFAIEEGEVDPASNLFLIRKQIAFFNKCVSNLEIDNSFKNAVSLVLDETVTEMKCIHPQDGTLVLCETINAASITTPSVCVMQSKSDPESILYEILEFNVCTCFLQYLNYDFEAYGTSSDIAALRQDTSYFCRLNINDYKCYNHEITYAEMCLHGTQQKEWKLLQDVIKDAFEISCSDNGTRLADIMLDVYSLKRTSNPKPDPVSECVAVAKSTRQQNHRDESSSQSLRFYREFRAFKECFLNKLDRQNPAVKAAESFMNETLKKVKCIHPGDGTTVLCETNVNN